MSNIANEKSVPLSQTGLFGKDKDRIEEVSERSGNTGQTTTGQNSPEEMIRGRNGSRMSMPAETKKEQSFNRFKKKKGSMF